MYLRWLVFVLIVASINVSAQEFKKHQDSIYFFFNKMDDSTLNTTVDIKILDTYPNYPIKFKKEIEKPRKEAFLLEYYTGKPLKKGIEGTVFINPAEDFPNQNKVYLPYSAFYYQNPSSIEPIVNTNFFSSEEVSSIPLKEIFKPFYFSEFEVTNLEYREFIHYTRDSIARQMLGEDFPKEFLIPTYDENGDEKDQEDWLINWETEFRYAYYTKEKHPYEVILEDMFYPQNQRFYRRKEFDTRKLNYSYIENGEKKIVNVYPDTTGWTRDYPMRKVEILENLYNWHPALDDYPVVGITWEQANAYCHWYTKKLNKKLAAEGYDIKVKVSLPSIIQWEQVKNTFETKNHSLFWDNRVEKSNPFNWETNLKLSPDHYFPHLAEEVVLDESYYELSYEERVNLLLSRRHSFFNENTFDYTYFRNDQSFFWNLLPVYGKKLRSPNYKYEYSKWQRRKGKPETVREIEYKDSIYLARLEQFKSIHGKNYKKEIKQYHYDPYIGQFVLYEDRLTLNTDHTGIKNMGSNVSEWLLESYENNWKYLNFKRHELLIKSSGADADITALKEVYLNQYNNEDGHLVVGSNWLDERVGLQYGKNMKGINSKVFSSKAYPTVGFRYVILIED